jgi:hypothetical protein
VPPRVISRQALVERELRRLAVLVRVLSVVLLTLTGRVLLGGLTGHCEVAAALVATVLAVAAALLRKGRRLEIVLSTSTQTPDRTL